MWHVIACPVGNARFVTGRVESLVLAYLAIDDTSEKSGGDRLLRPFAVVWK